MVRALPVGNVLVYSFSWAHGVDLSGKSAGQIRGEVKLAGELRVESIGMINGLNAMRLSFQNVQLQKVDLPGRSPVARGDEETAAPKNPMGPNETATVLVDAGGMFRGFHVQPSATSFFLNLMQRLIELTGVRHTDAKSLDAKQWTTTEHAPFGRAVTAYVDDNKAGVRRTHVRYTDVEGLSADSDPASLEQQLHASSRLEATPEHVLRVVDDEQLTVLDAAKKPVFEGEHHFRFDLANRSTVTPPPEPNLSGLVARNLDQLAAGEMLKRSMLQQRIAGLTPELMVERIRNMGVLGKLSQQNEFFYRATGLLKMQPKLASGLPDLFFEPDNTYPGQAFILDLLVGANTVEAQAAIQQILENGPVQQRKSFATLYQRISSFSSPTLPLAEFAARQYDTHRTAPRVESDSFAGDAGGPNDDMPSAEEARWIRRVAATYSLGSIASHLFRSGNVTLARKYNGWLLRDVREAKTPAEIDALLHGLGNAGLMENLDVLLEFTRHALPELRDAAASGLHGLDVAPARARLLELLEDPSIDVQRQAQRTLDTCALADEDVQRLLTIVREGKASSTLDAGWIGFFDRKRLRGAEAESALSAIATRHPEDSDLQRRIAGALGATAVTPKNAPKK
jgi:hypothetical protein